MDADGLYPVDTRTVPLLALLRYTTRDVSSQFTQTMERILHADKSLDASEKRQALHDTFERIRIMLTRLLVVSSWSLDHEERIPGLIDAIQSVRNERIQFADMGDRLMDTHSRSFLEREISADMNTAADVFVIGQPGSFPTGPSKAFKTFRAESSNATDAGKKHDMLQKLDAELHSRLMRCSFPSSITSVKIDNYKLVMRTAGLYMVSLTVTSADASGFWRIVDPVHSFVSSGARWSLPDDGGSPTSREVDKSLKKTIGNANLWRGLEQRMAEIQGPPPSGPASWSASLEFLHKMLSSACLLESMQLILYQARVFADRSNLGSSIKVVDQPPDTILCYWKDIPRLPREDAYALIDMDQNRQDVRLFAGQVRFRKAEDHIEVSHAPSLAGFSPLHLDTGKIDVASILFDLSARHAAQKASKMAAILSEAGYKTVHRKNSVAVELSVAINEERVVRKIVYSVDPRSGLLCAALTDLDSAVPLQWLSDYLASHQKRSIREYKKMFISCSENVRTTSTAVVADQLAAANPNSGILDIVELTSLIQSRLVLHDVQQCLSVLGTNVLLVEDEMVLPSSSQNPSLVQTPAPGANATAPVPSKPLPWIPRSHIRAPFLFINGQLCVSSFVVRNKTVEKGTVEPYVRMDSFALRPPSQTATLACVHLPSAYLSLPSHSPQAYFLALANTLVQVSRQAIV
eukprot:ANDGO_00234.mRNA.1 hypothetical protein